MGRTAPGTSAGRGSFYCISPEEYKLIETQHVLNGLYQGSVKNLISAMYDGDKLSEQDIEEMKQWFSEK
ncbi:Penicillinase repressor [compost metagenome]